MELVKVLQNEYGFNTPILLSEIIFAGMKGVNLRQALTRLTKQGRIERFAQGVYYFSTVTALGKTKLSSKMVYEKKYVTLEKSVYGFYSGITFDNALGLTTQMANVVEIVTNNESSRLREIKIGKQKIRLRKSRVTITANNAITLQFLDLLNRKGLDELMEGKEVIRKYIENEKIAKEEVFRYIGDFPSKVSKNLIESRLINELTCG